MVALFFIILRFFHLRLGEILAFLNLFQCAINRRVAVSLFLVLLSHEQVFLLGFEHPLQAISDSESFLLCEHFHI